MAVSAGARRLAVVAGMDMGGSQVGLGGPDLLDETCHGVRAGGPAPGPLGVDGLAEVAQEATIQVLLELGVASRIGRVTSGFAK